VSSASPAKISDVQAESRVPDTLPGFCLDAVTRHRKADAVCEKRGDQWVQVSGEEFIRRVRHIALGLKDLGIKPGDRVALMSENRPEWSIADLAILSVGAVTVPLYTTQAVDQIDYILKDSSTRALLISGGRVLKHARKGFEDSNQLDYVVIFDSADAGEVERSVTLEDIETRGAEIEVQSPESFDEELARGSADDLATIIYTSGTTGEPKGVMLTHANFIANVRSICDGLPISATDTSLSVLPLSHIFERTVFYVFCYMGVSVNYAASLDHVGEYLREVKPTIMTAVPRLFESVYHRIIKKGMSAGGLKTRIFERSLRIGQRVAELEDKQKRVPLTLRARHAVADRLVFTKWREGIGGRLRYFVSGGAPLSPTLSYSFLGAGIKILQGYGMTETCIVCANRPEDNRVGSIGKPFKDIEMKIAEDGEMLIRGPNVMKGYYRHPQATEAVMHDGWLATGDVGYQGKGGHFFITDRKKDLFKLSNGKYVAPQQIESLLKQSEFINQVVVVGSSRKFPVALIVPHWEALRSALRDSGETIPDKRKELSERPAALKLVQKDVTRLTAHLADYERVRRIALLPEEFSIDSGEMTPTLKVKRNVVDQKFGGLIEELYQS
jgi:long-chain acyl-CoA synthetase